MTMWTSVGSVAVFAAVLTGPARAQPVTSGPPALALQPSPGDPPLQTHRQEHCRVEADRRSVLGQRLVARHQYGQATREQALSYAFQPGAERLLRLAQTAQRADLDLEALSIYQRLQAETPADPGAGELAVAVDGLLAKLEDPDIGIPRALRTHIEQGRQRFQEGKFLLAAEEYALAYAMKPLPRLLFNLAQAFRRAGRTDDAYVVYGHFVQAEQPTPLRKEGIGYLAELGTTAFRPPQYKRAWFWGVVGTAAAAVVAGTAGLVVGLQSKNPPTDVQGTLMFGLRY